MRARYALLVGVGNYAASAQSRLPPLPEVEENLIRLNDFLTRGLHADYQYTDTNSLILSDTKVTVGTLNATFNKIHEKNAGELLIYITGHGILDISGSPYFCTYDYSEDDPGMALSILQTKLQWLAVKHQVMAVLDFCHAGAIVEGADSKRKLSILASARQEQKAAAGSQFFNAFVEGWKGNGADGTTLSSVEKQKVLWPKLTTYVQMKIETEGEQTVSVFNTSALSDLTLNQLGSPATVPSVPLATSSAPLSVAPPKCFRPFEVWSHENLYFVRTMMSLRKLERDGHLFPTASVPAIIQALTAHGAVAIVDLPGTGKTCAAYQVGAAFHRGVSTANGTLRLPVYYAEVSALRTEQAQLSAFLAAQPNALVILDKAHQDHDLTMCILSEWSPPLEHRGPRLLLIADEGPVPKPPEHDSLGTIMQGEQVWYHLVIDKQKALSDRHEFDKFCQFYLKLCRRSPGQPQDFDSNFARTKFDGSLALAMLCMEEAIDLREKDTAKRLLAQIHRQKTIDSANQNAAIKVGLFSYFCPSIVWDAFESAFRVSLGPLNQRKFLQINSDGKTYRIFLTALAPMYHGTYWNKLEDEMIAGMDRYIRHVGANADELLDGIRKSEDRRVLREVVNEHLNAILAYTQHESSLAKVAGVFECVRQVGWRAAQSLVSRTVAAGLRRDDENARYLSKLLGENSSAAEVGAYLNAVTTIARYALRSSSKPDLEAEGWQQALRRLLAKPTTSLREAEIVCQAVFRSNRAFAVELIAKAAETHSLSSTQIGPGLPPLEQVLRFAATAKKIDPHLALKISRREPAEKVAATMIAQVHSSRQARQQLSNWGRLDRRFAQQVLHCLLNMQGFLHWYENLFAQHDDLFPVIHFLRAASQINRAAAARLVELTVTTLEELYRKDDRLPARGELISTIKQVASSTLPRLVTEPILQEFVQQIYLSSKPLHIMRALQTLHNVNAVRAEQAVVNAGCAHWSKLLVGIEQLRSFGQLVNILAKILGHSTDFLLKIIYGEGVRDNLRNLVEHAIRHRPQDFYYIVSMLVCSQDIPADVGDQILSLIKELLPEESGHIKLYGGNHPLLDIRDKPDVYAKGLRAMALAFPVDTQRYVEDQLDAKNVKTMKRSWSYGASPAALATLINITYAVDVRMATIIATSIKDVEEIIQSEPQRYHAMLLLRAMAQTAADSARKAAQLSFKTQDVVDLFTHAADLRELTVTLDSWRDADSESFRTQLQAALKDRGKAEKLLQELSIRLAEESNLGVIAVCLSLLLSVSAHEAHAQLRLFLERQGPWIREFSIEQNRFPQVLSFVSTGVRIVKSRDAVSPPLPAGEAAEIINKLCELVQPASKVSDKHWHEYSPIERLLSEVRGINALTFCLPDLYLLSDLLGDPDFAEDLFARCSHGATKQFIQYSKDAMGCALLAFLLGGLHHPHAAELREVARHRVVELAPRYRLVPRFISLALVGELDSEPVVLEQWQSIPLWQIGYIDWLRHQQLAAQNRSARPTPLSRLLNINFQRHVHTVSNIAQELDALSNPAKQAFFLFGITQLEIEVPPQTLLREETAMANKLVRHPVPTIRKLGAIFSATNPFAITEPDYYQVSYLMRTLAPQVYSYGIDSDGLLPETDT